MEYYSALKRDEIPICAKIWMNLENIMLIEIKTQKATHLLFDSTYVKLNFIREKNVSVKKIF